MKDIKVDKGFEFYYFNLSNRRKYLRTWWTLPFLIAALVYIWLTSPDKLIFNSIFTVLLITIWFVQLFYTYTKWKIEKNYSK